MVIEPTKLCNGPLCNGIRKPWSAFYQTRTGNPRWVCRDCETHINATRQRVRRLENPEPMRVVARAGYKKRKRDPEWLDNRRAYNRELANRRRRAKGISERPKRGPMKTQRASNAAF